MHLTNVLALALAASSSALPVEQSLEEIHKQSQFTKPDGPELNQRSYHLLDNQATVPEGSGLNARDNGNGGMMPTKFMNKGGPVMSNANGLSPDVLASGAEIVPTEQLCGAGGCTHGTTQEETLVPQHIKTSTQELCGSGGCTHGTAQEEIVEPREITTGTQELCGNGGCTHGGKSQAWQQSEGNGQQNTQGGFVNEVRKLVGLGVGANDAHTQGKEKVARSHFFGQAYQMGEGREDSFVQGGPKGDHVLAQGPRGGDDVFMAGGLGQGQVAAQGQGVGSQLQARSHRAFFQESQSGEIGIRSHMRNQFDQTGSVSPRSEQEESRTLYTDARGHVYTVTSDVRQSLYNGHPVVDVESRANTQQAAVWAQTQQEAEHNPNSMDSIVGGEQQRMAKGQGLEGQFAGSSNGQLMQARAEGSRVVEEDRRGRANTIYQGPKQELIVGKEQGYSQVKGQRQRQGQF